MLSGCNVNININPDGGTDEQTSGEVTQEQIEENIIGTWMISEVDGQPALTNEKRVLDIVSTTKAYSSLSRADTPASPFDNRTKANVNIKGNTLTITFYSENEREVIHEYIITDISANEFTGKICLPVFVNDSEPTLIENVVTFVKVNYDYASDIIGTWEGHCTSEGSVFDDGQEHRWEYKADGTFVYYVKDGDSWVPKEDQLDEYFVAGNLLFTRWVNDDGENREWWEISIDGDTMNWTALRADEDGNTYTATFEMNRVEGTSSEVTQEQIEENIIGKWMTSERDGQPALTDEKNVYDIVSTTETYVSLSRSKGKSPWNNGVKRSVDIKGNVVTIAPFPGDNSSVVNEFTITDISDNEFTANVKNTRTVDGAEPVVTERVDTYVRVNEDFSDDIIGIWEGHCISEGSVFDDGQYHRWEYKTDGTYVYYVKDGDDWVPSKNTLNEYFMAGKLLCTRWMEGDVENREWWEISIDGDTMNWTALREDEDGNTYTAAFEMTRITE